MDNPCITLKETARTLHLKDDTLMAWIQRGDCPFGVYVKKPGKTHGHYIIIRTRFERYLSGEDMRPADLQSLIEKISELEQKIDKLKPQE